MKKNLRIVTPAEALELRFFVVVVADVADC